MTTSSNTGRFTVCLICGIHTNLSLNIFEPRNGPNIVDVIYLKYKFRAERDENEDKYICYSCNNWLINWHSLQNKSDSQNCESIPSSSKSENRYKRSRNAAIPEIYEADSSSDKENYTEFNDPDDCCKGTDDEDDGCLKYVYGDGEQDQEISSSTIDCKQYLNAHNLNRISMHFLPKKKYKCYYCHKKFPKREYRRDHIELVHGHCSRYFSLSRSVSGSTLDENLVSQPPILDANLIQMLRKQGTIISKEESPYTSPSYMLAASAAATQPQAKQKRPKVYHNNDSEIVLSFNTAISEVMKVQLFDQPQHVLKENNAILTCKLPKSLTVSLVDP